MKQATCVAVLLPRDLSAYATSLADRVQNAADAESLLVKSDDLSITVCSWNKIAAPSTRILRNVVMHHAPLIRDNVRMEPRLHISPEGIVSWNVRLAQGLLTFARKVSDETGSKMTIVPLRFSIPIAVLADLSHRRAVDEIIGASIEFVPREVCIGTYGRFGNMTDYRERFYDQEPA